MAIHADRPFADAPCGRSRERLRVTFKENVRYASAALPGTSPDIGINVSEISRTLEILEPRCKLIGGAVTESVACDSLRTCLNVADDPREAAFQLSQFDAGRAGGGTVCTGPS